MLSSRINTDLTDSKGSKDRQSVIKGSKGEGIGKMKQLADLQKDKFQLARRNTIKTLLIVGCGFIICWTQNQVLYLLYNLGYPVDFNGTYFQYTVLMGFLNCTVNPFIYLAQYRDYQMALKLFLRCNTEISKHSDGNNQPSYIFNSKSTRSDLTSNQ